MNMWRARADNRLSFNDLSVSVLSVPVKNLYKSVNIFYNMYLCRADMMLSAGPGPPAIAGPSLSCEGTEKVIRLECQIGRAHV